MEVKRVLFVLSFAPSYEKGMRLAEGLVAESGGKLYIMDAYKTSPSLFYSTVSPFYTSQLERERDETINRIGAFVRDELLKLGRDVLFEELAHPNEDPVKAILRESKDKQAELIIIGHHEDSELERLLFGGQIARLVNEAPCDVMVVRRGARAAAEEARLAA